MHGKIPTFRTSHPATLLAGQPISGHHVTVLSPHSSSASAASYTPSATRHPRVRQRSMYHRPWSGSRPNALAMAATTIHCMKRALPAPPSNTGKDDVVAVAGSCVFWPRPWSNRRPAAHHEVTDCYAGRCTFLPRSSLNQACDVT